MKSILTLFALFSVVFSLSSAEFKWYGPETGFATQADWTYYQNNAEAATGAARAKSSVVAPQGYALASTANTPAAVIPAGDYRVWINFYAYGQRGKIQAVCRAGGTSAGVLVNEADSDGPWATLGVINIPTDTDRINFLFYATNDIVGNVVFPGTMIGIYMNTDTSLVMTKDGYAQKWVLSSASDGSAAIPGNYIFNSSFELPPDDSAVTIHSNEGRTYALTDTWVSGDSWHGDKHLSVVMDRCTSVIPSTWINAPVVRLRPDKPHTMRVYAKASTTPATLQLAIRNSNPTVPPGYGLPAQPVVQSVIFNLTTSWVPYTFEGFVPRAYPYSDFAPEMVITSSAGARIDLDGWSLEEGGSPTAYGPAWNRELSVGSDKMGNIYYDDEGAPQLNFNVMEYGTTGNDTVHYKVYWGPNDLLATSSFSVTTASGGVVSTAVPLGVTKLGPYRIEAWLNSNGLKVESHFSLIKRPRTLTWAQRRIGTDVQGAHQNMQILDRLGVRAFRALSPGAQFRWSISEPTAGNFVFSDEFTEALTQYDFVPLGNLYQEPQSWAQRITLTLTNIVGPGFQVGEIVTQGAVSGKVTWVSSPTGPLIGAIQLTNKVGGDFLVANGTVTGGTSGTTAVGAPIQTFNEGTQTRVNLMQNHLSDDIVRYAEYAGTVAGHHTNVVYWEIWNEPGRAYSSDINGDYALAFYAEHVIRSVDAIKAANPNAKVCVPGGMTIDSTSITRANMLWNFLPTATRNKIDLFNYHIYPDAGPFAPSLRTFAASIGKESWDTESGWEDIGNRVGWMAPWYYLGAAMQPYTYVANYFRGALATPQMISTNCMEVLGAGHTKLFYYDCRNFHTSKSTINHYTMLDGDDTVKPKAAVLAWVEQVTGGGTGMGKLALVNGANKAIAYRYDGGLDGKDWIFLTSFRGKFEMNWSILADQVEVYDMYGNRITTTGTVITFGQGGVYIKGTGTTGAAMATAIQGGGVTFTAMPDITAPNLIFLDFPTPTVRALDKTRVLARWAAYDELSIPQPSYPNAILSRWRVNGGAWSGFGGDSFIQVDNPASGTYTVDVEARDEALNTSSITGTFVVP